MASELFLKAIQAELDRMSGKNNKVFNSESEETKVYNPNPSPAVQEPSPRQRTTTCFCGEEVKVFTVKKEGISQGDLFASCPSCERFQWLHLPVCRKCGERCYQAQSKPNKHGKRKWFLACPNRCVFRWLSGRIRGGYEVE